MTTPSRRVAVTRNSCRSIDDHTIDIFTYYCGDFKDIFRGKPVLDVGCGQRGGLCDFVLGQGATKYVGVDIDETAIAFSWCAEKRGTFIWDDPIHVLSTLKKPHIVVSAAIFDNCIIEDIQYAERLIQAISQQTPTGWHTAHWAADLYHYGRHFSRAGLDRMNTNTQNERECFGVYQKTAEEGRQ